RGVAGSRLSGPLSSRAWRSGRPAVCPLKQRVKLGLRKFNVIEKLIELARFLPEVEWKAVAVKDVGKPCKADQTIDRRRAVDPAEGSRRREIDTAFLHRLDARPHRIGPCLDAGVEVPVPRDDNVGVPDEDLLRRDLDDAAALTAGVGDIAAAG